MPSASSSSTPGSSGGSGYSGTPLPTKLGIKAEHRVLLVAAPPDFALDPLPGGVTIDHAASGRYDAASGLYDVVLVFCANQAALVGSFDPLKQRLGPASALWVAWPKKSSQVPTDLTENGVREHGLAGGLVDVKICAVDPVWSGLKFVYRTADRPTVSRTQA